MPRIMISFEDSRLLQEIEKIISKLYYFEICEINTSINLNSSLKNFLHKNDLHFLIYTKDLNYNSVIELQEISFNFPWIFSIYYHSNLKNKQFHALHDSGVKSCIIGTRRTEYLKTNLPVFWEKHWKRIPSFLYPKDEKNLSPRAKLIIKNIENQQIREFNIKSLSENLKISEPHFRSVFKNLFEINFQGFKQKLLAHYEIQLLFGQKIKANIVSTILNYKGISNFSKSFKSRHGGCLRKFETCKMNLDMNI